MEKIEAIIQFRQWPELLKRPESNCGQVVEVDIPFECEIKPKLCRVLTALWYVNLHWTSRSVAFLTNFSTKI
jgi:hypothetical protein